MPYVKNPIVYPSGKVSEQTAQINTNFSILADAFYNSDPENSPIYRACYVGITAPLNPKVGQLWVDTSVAPPVIKVYNGTNWLEVKPASVDTPSTPYIGQFWFDTTVSPPVLKIYDGTNWQVVNAPYEGNTAPSTPYIGQLWFDTSVNPPVLKIYDGTNWQSNVSNADKLDGQEGSYYLNRANHTGTQPPSSISPQGSGSGLNADKLDGQEGSYYLNRANHTGTQPPSSISPQGSGSGLNADMLDTFHASLTPGPNVIVPLNASGFLDLSATYVKSNVYTFRRVDLTNATSDYNLQVGEEAYISFTNATSVPLRIATQSGTMYEMDVISSANVGTSGATSSPTYLNPNNTTYSNAFTYVEVYVTFGASGPGYSTVTYSSFRIGWGYSDERVYLVNFTNHKTVRGINIATGQSNAPVMNCYVSQWNDTTTAWTSLGTFVFPQAMSGIILVRRLA